ncbi:hypothetical protein [Streptosporangium canum]|uniref:hypothetical protein n=1 Tax=Streptosporangium canum TaxID=324952 RepID=UPI003798EA47
MKSQIHNSAEDQPNPLVARLALTAVSGFQYSYRPPPSRTIATVRSPIGVVTVPRRRQPVVGGLCRRALADVLLGRTEPGGRMPTTWPGALEDCPVVNVTPVDGVLRYDEGVLRLGAVG